MKKNFKREKKKATINRELLFKILVEIEKCGKHLPISDKCDIVADAYERFIHSFMEYGPELRYYLLIAFIEVRVEYSGVEL